MESTYGTFVVVCRTRSAAIFKEGVGWVVRYHSKSANSESTELVVTFRTEYEQLGFESRVPRWLSAEIVGPADSVDDAAQRFANIARTLTPLIDVALNTTVEDLELHLAFDATPGRARRPFFQNFIREPRPTLRQVRPAERGLLSSLVRAMSSHRESVRLHRAAAHYQQALRFWEIGDETRAVAQIWMGIEALTPIVKRAEMSRLGASTSGELAAALGIEQKAIDGTLRRTHLFNNDDRVYATTLNVSNGFEHGYMPLDELRSLAIGVREAAARYLRTAIINSSQVPEPMCSQMLKPPFDTPIIGFPITKYLRGTLVGEGDLAAADQRYPIVSWKSSLQVFKLTSAGGHDVQWSENITPRLSEGIGLTDVRVEFWSGDGNTGTTASVLNAQVGGRDVSPEPLSTDGPETSDTDGSEEES